MLCAGLFVFLFGLVLFCYFVVFDSFCALNYLCWFCMGLFVVCFVVDCVCLFIRFTLCLLIMGLFGCWD